MLDEIPPDAQQRLQSLGDLSASNAGSSAGRLGMRQREGSGGARKAVCKNSYGYELPERHSKWPFIVDSG